jgi:hypothetical protein
MRHKLLVAVVVGSHIAAFARQQVTQTLQASRVHHLNLLSPHNGLPRKEVRRRLDHAARTYELQP